VAKVGRETIRRMLMRLAETVAGKNGASKVDEEY
jgi:hypothetical protein